MKIKPKSSNQRRIARQALGSRTQRRRNTGLFPRFVGTGKVKQGKINPSKVFKGKEHQQPQPRVLVERTLRRVALEGK
jgi:hypothetical protein